jgi:phosphoribosylformylglycinamidine (FGAM) synthase PurS component
MHATRNLKAGDEMQVPESDKETEIRDQAEFDKAVVKDGKIVLQVLAGVGVFAALLMSIIALSQSSEHNTVTITSGTAAPVTSSTASSGPNKVAPELVSLKVIPEGRLGPDKLKHDYYTKTEFKVKVGQTLELKIDNTDEGEHSITSPEIGVNIIVKPGIHTYEMVVKEKGKFSWFCVIPCDSNANGWAMQHAGYMGGYITAT